ncbi:MAG: pantoate--beta-alanine ligase [Gammaproteobacteria bacterium]|nr:pantoate--beta-alanine ligase [Gammaproteobacteria bacterium]
MKIIKLASEANRYVADIKSSGREIGFVPTLGGLHKGHQLLMQRACEENDVTVISTFLNPMQFRKKQFIEYPKDFEEDKLAAEEADVAMMFHPSIEEMFRTVQKTDCLFDFQNDNFPNRCNDRFVIETKDKNGIDNLVRVPSNLLYRLDGILHPWFFDGSATIVYRLFNILRPTRTYFGEKDIQQVAIISKLIDACFPDIQMASVPTLREADGLAFSSRNVLLSKEQRCSALSVYLALKHGENLIMEGESDREAILTKIKAIIATESAIIIDYLDIVDRRSLEPAERIHGDAILYAAFFLDTIRLTDTVIVTPSNRT